MSLRFVYCYFFSFESSMETSHCITFGTQNKNAKIEKGFQIGRRGCIKKMFYTNNGRMWCNTIKMDRKSFIICYHDSHICMEIVILDSQTCTRIFLETINLFRFILSVHVLVRFLSFPFSSMFSTLSKNVFFYFLVASKISMGFSCV